MQWVKGLESVVEWNGKMMQDMREFVRVITNSI